MIARLYRRIYRHVAEMRWDALLALGLAHFAISWALAAISESGDVTSRTVFWYYYLVTATTVGYGDFAPQTTWGRVVAVAWIMPGAIALFTTAIAKAAQAMAESWRRNMRGRGDYSKLDNHIVLIGWRGERSERLIEQLADTIDLDAPEIVIVGVSISQNPAPDRAHFIKAESFSDDDALKRAGLEHAMAAIVMAATDADDLAAALAANAVAPNLRLVVYFEDEGMANLLKAHCPTAETATSLSIELLARAARDEGSAELFYMLASSQQGPTEYSVLAPDDLKAAQFGPAMLALKRHHDATLIAVKHEGERLATLNPAWDAPIRGGDRLYYVARERIDANKIDWEAMA